MDCEAFVWFKATKYGEYLAVKAINLQHNHPINVVRCQSCNNNQMDYL